MGKRPAQGDLISGSALHDLSLPDMPQGRLHHGAPVGVLDVGSNSVRLVIYEHLSRSLTPLFNEKISCALNGSTPSPGITRSEVPSGNNCQLC